MSFTTDLTKEVDEVFRASWQKRTGYVVPEPSDLKLGNDAVELEGTVLYADLAESTKLVDSETDTFAAEVYKTYLLCAARVIRKNDGVVTAFDGDRVMAVFIGDSKNSSAARAALQINYAVNEIVNPSLKRVYTSNDYTVRQAVGIDTSDLLVARTGIRGSNDLVWVGKAANHAAKLCALRDGHPSHITEAVFKRLSKETKYSSDGTQTMWERCVWSERNEIIYRSNWQWNPG
jgi:class 3 adenylate cyclase